MEMCAVQSCRISAPLLCLVLCVVACACTIAIRKCSLHKHPRPEQTLVRRASFLFFFIGMAYIIMPNIVMAYIVMANIVMAYKNEICIGIADGSK